MFDTEAGKCGRNRKLRGSCLVLTTAVRVHDHKGLPANSPADVSQNVSRTSEMSAVNLFTGVLSVLVPLNTVKLNPNSTTRSLRIRTATGLCHVRCGSKNGSRRRLGSLLLCSQKRT
jgi:hypothetical protein